MPSAPSPTIITDHAVELYLAAIEQMLQEGYVYLRYRDTPADELTIWPVSRTLQAECLGWYDEFYLYLLPKVAFGAVWRFHLREGAIFPATERGIREKLLEQRLSFPQPDSRADRFTYRLMLADNRPHVLRVTRALSTNPNL